ncbi:hypothetical protein SYNPS1DRAFT_28364 [Syncephalis pseudoplumigaleata]|uniref:Uncharacterized protein n=1 Tax=Syncephalis pseudoplumigaleata TaxID=1712513 RepID=A0A4P9Z348_9FUNG|nr:hypothetical protein SYNPS1DRAFT_28364 [Syncephalis pseudoplumigaleata]|eukprot:RKP25920.1 hypothetical protein SYNPS1DRAFT_28364 [Syncephalis pseudoplumigaleata]
MILRKRSSISLLLAMLLAWCHHSVHLAMASLTVYGPKQMMTMRTQDVVYRHVPFYRRTGVSVIWPWNVEHAGSNGGGNCTFLPPKRWPGNLVDEAKFAASAKGIALLVYFVADAGQQDDYATVADMARAGCGSVAQVAYAARQLDKQLSRAGFPPVTLLVLVPLSSMEVPLWGPSTGPYTSAIPAHREDHTYVDVALVDRSDGRAFYRKFGQERRFMNFMAIEARIGAALLDCAIAAAVLAQAEAERFSAGAIPADIALLDPTMHDIKFLARPIRLAIRTFSIIHMLLVWLAMMANLCLVFSDASERLGDSVILAGKTYVPLVSSLALLVYGGFGALLFWKARYAVDLSSHRTKLSMLSLCFMAISSTFIVQTLDNYFIGYKSEHFMAKTEESMITMEAALNMAHAVRAVLCFVFIGMDWPRKRSAIIAPASKVTAPNPAAEKRARQQPQVIMSLYDETASSSLLPRRSTPSRPKLALPGMDQPVKRPKTVPLAIEITKPYATSHDAAHRPKKPMLTCMPAANTPAVSSGSSRSNRTFATSNLDMERCTFILGRDDPQNPTSSLQVNASSSSSNSNNGSELTRNADTMESVYVIPVVSVQGSNATLNGQTNDDRNHSA